MIDAHCHLQDDAFGEDRDTVIREALNRGVEKFVVNGTREQDWESVAALARRHPDFILPSFGLHPWFVAGRSDDWEKRLLDYLGEFPGAGVGEIGLDRWMKNPEPEQQESVFRRQWEIARERERPVTVHCLRAWGWLETVLGKLPRHPFLLHSYSGSAEMANVLLPLGAYFSISGYFFRPEKENRLAAFDVIPPDRLLVETDAPEMPLPPDLDLHPERSFNHPANLVVIAERTANRRGVEIGAFERQVSDNFLAWFGQR